MAYQNPYAQAAANQNKKKKKPTVNPTSMYNPTAAYATGESGDHVQPTATYATSDASVAGRWSPTPSPRR